MSVDRAVLARLTLVVVGCLGLAGCGENDPQINASDAGGTPSEDFESLIVEYECGSDDESLALELDYGQGDAGLDGDALEASREWVEDDSIVLEVLGSTGDRQYVTGRAPDGERVFDLKLDPALDGGLWVVHYQGCRHNLPAGLQPPS
jgi:hypothetical protein